MNYRAGLFLIGASLVLASCGSRTVLDDAKDAYLAECPGETFSTLLNGYFITGLDSNTLWTAYRTDDPDIVRVTGEGNVSYVGVTTKATVEAMYNSVRDELTLSGVKFNGTEQPRAFAEALISNACDEAKGLN